MTLTPDEREAAIEKMAQALYAEKVRKPWAAVRVEHRRYWLKKAATALDAVLPLIERAVLLRAAKVAEGPAASWGEYQGGTLERDRIATKLRALADEVRT